MTDPEDTFLTRQRNSGLQKITVGYIFCKALFLLSIESKTSTVQEARGQWMFLQWKISGGFWYLHWSIDDWSLQQINKCQVILQQSTCWIKGVCTFCLLFMLYKGNSQACKISIGTHINANAIRNLHHRVIFENSPKNALPNVLGSAMSMKKFNSYVDVNLHCSEINKLT